MHSVETEEVREDLERLRAETEALRSHGRLTEGQRIRVENLERGITRREQMLRGH
jgi:hypothetical protein